MPKISRHLNTDNDTVIKCAHAVVPLICHFYFPSCDGTQGEYKKQKVCRETCIKLTHICSRIWGIFVKAL